MRRNSSPELYLVYKYLEKFLSAHTHTQLFTPYFFLCLFFHFPRPQLRVFLAEWVFDVVKLPRQFVNEYFKGAFRKAAESTKWLLSQPPPSMKTASHGLHISVPLSPRGQAG